MRRVVLVVSVLVALIAAPQALAVSPGDDVPSFTITDSQPFTGGTNNSIEDLVQQPDGKIVTVSNDYNDGAQLLRYNANGTRDTTFATNGVFEDLTMPTIGSTAVTLDAQGRIVFAGHDTNGNLAVGRLTSSGAYDAAFGVAGIARVAFGSTTDWRVAKLFVLADGKVLVAGHATYAGDNDFAVARLSSTGSPDGSFGTAGFARAGTSAFEDASDTVLLSNGMVVVVGQRGGLTPATRGALAFGFTTAGASTPEVFRQGEGTEHGGSEVPWMFTAATATGPSTLRATMDSAGGYPVLGTYMVQLVATATTLTLDTSYSFNGVSEQLPTYTSTSSLIRQADGKYLIGGWSPQFFKMRVIRMLADGETFDTSFGTGGTREVASIDPWNDHDTELLETADGGILVAGNKRDDDVAPTFRLWLSKVAGRIARTTTSVTASPMSVIAGAATSATVTVTAAGPDVTTAVSTRVTVPASVRVTASPATCIAASATEWDCTSAFTAATGSVSHTFQLATGAAGVTAISAVSSSAIYDDVAADNSATANVTAATLTKARVTAAFQQLVKVRGKLVASTCGASVKKACTASRVMRGVKLVAVSLRATVKPATTRVPAKATVQVQQQVRGRWVATKGGSVSIAAKTNLGTWALPKSLRAKAGVVRLRVVVAGSDVTLPATSAWRYVRIR